jgi:hypothetical protein
LWTKLKLRTPFDDAKVRNIGVGGVVFDPAIHPVMEFFWWGLAIGTGYLGGRELNKLFSDKE